MHWIALHAQPEDDNSAALTDAPCALAWWVLQFTPLVARVQDSLVLEVSGSARLFGGLAGLLHMLVHPPQPLAIACAAQGDTALLALGRLWSVREGHLSAPAAQEAPPEALSLEVLMAARPHLPTLMRLGCTTWGHLRALPRGGVTRRFGAELVRALDCAFGASPEVYPWLTLPDHFDASLELSTSAETATALLFGVRRLLAQLLLWLRARQQGVAALELLWQLDPRRSNTRYRDLHHSGNHQGRLELRTAQPTQDMQHLQRLLGEQLAHVCLPSPVLHVRLRTVQTQALSGASHSLLPEDQRSGNSLLQMAESLVARLGPEQLLRVQLQADQRPERMQRWSPWTQASPVHASSAEVGASQSHTTPAASLLYPTWLLATPQRLSVRQGSPYYHGPLELVAGPQRLESGWLEGVAALRDYFVARSGAAGLVWIYRERQPATVASHSAWFLHGLFG